MADYEVSVKGVDVVCKLLEEAPTQIVKNCFAKALAAAAVPLYNAMFVRCPIESGYMKEHMFTDIQIDRQGKGGIAHVGFKSHAAHLVEYGHRMIGHLPEKKEEKGDPVIPHPFIRPAAVAAAEDVGKAFAETMRESLENDVK